jgi:hypothetical protein
MTNFLKDCYFNCFCKGRNNFVPTPRYAKKLRAMRHSAEFKKSFVSDFLVDSALCHIAGSRDCTLCGIAQSCEFESICKTVLAHESGDPGVQFKGIVSRDFVVCFLVSFDRSDISTHQEWVLLLLKVHFCIEFFDFRVWA